MRSSWHAEMQVPEYFAEDLFSVMGDQRPDWRWLIVGPPKSGSSFHKVSGSAPPAQPPPLCSL